MPTSSTSSTSSPVLSAIATSQAVMPGYFSKTLTQRLQGGAGSIFPQFQTDKTLISALKSATWQAWADCPNLLPGCQAFRAPIPGLMGVVTLDSLHPGTPVVLDDRKNTGTASCTVSLASLGSDPRKGVDFTTIIIGEDGGHTVVFTLHPGAPVRPSSVKAEKGMHGRQITAGQALGMGLTTAKVVD